MHNRKRGGTQGIPAAISNEPIPNNKEPSDNLAGGEAEEGMNYKSQLLREATLQMLHHHGDDRTAASHKMARKAQVFLYMHKRGVHL